MINTLKHLAFVLGVKPSEILELISSIDNYYYEKREVKLDKNGVPKLRNGAIQERILDPSKGDLKDLQKRINKRILQGLEMPSYAYGGIKHRDNVANASRHKGKKHIFTTDLKDFFPRISHRSVYDMYRLHKFSPEVSRILTMLTTYKGRVPQGAPTSSLVANLVFTKTGGVLDIFAKENNLTFTTFVDDLTFSSPTDFKEKVPCIIEILTNDSYKLSHRKTNYKTKFPIVTGVVVKNNSLDLTKEFKEKLANTTGKSKAQIKGLQRYADRVLAKK